MPAVAAADIVPVSGQDRTDIGRLYREMYGHLGQPEPPAGWIDEVLAQAVRGERTLLVARQEGRMLGFIDFKLFPYHAATESRFCRIFDLFVEPDAQRRGIGRQLWMRALRAAQDGGADAIELNVLPSNDKARAFWESQGFRLNLLGFRRALRQDADGRR